MQYKSNIRLSIDKRKLDVLLRLGCPENIIWEQIKTGKFVKTGDYLIDENLETFIDIKEFSNWGGKRINSGNKKKKHNQDEKQVDNHLENQDGKHLAELEIEQELDKEKVNIKKRPTLEEVKQYCFERNNNVDAQKWFDYYSSNGWKVGRNSMKDWKAAVRTWEKSSYDIEKQDEPTFIVESGQFYIDDTEKYSKGYSDLASQLTQEQRNKIGEWFFDKFYGKEVKLSFIRNVLKKVIEKGV